MLLYNLFVHDFLIKQIAMFSNVLCGKTLGIDTVINLVLRDLVPEIIPAKFVRG